MRMRRQGPGDAVCAHAPHRSGDAEGVSGRHQRDIRRIRLVEMRRQSQPFPGHHVRAKTRAERRRGQCPKPPTECLRSVRSTEALTAPSTASSCPRDGRELTRKFPAHRARFHTDSSTHSSPTRARRHKQQTPRRERPECGLQSEAGAGAGVVHAVVSVSGGTAIALWGGRERRPFDAPSAVAQIYERTTRCVP